MKINKILSSATLLYGMSMAMSVGSCATPVQTNLPGYTPGADIISVSPTRNQVDLIGDVVYSQIKGTRSVRQLHMSVLVPRTNDLKPASARAILISINLSCSEDMNPPPG